MKTFLKHKNSDVDFIGIVSAKDWFDGQKIPFPFFEYDYVVGEWCDFYDGENSHIEGKLTYAICKVLDDAEALYKHRVDKFS